MTGPDHYRTAARLLRGLQQEPTGPRGAAVAQVIATAAQAHATLALVAATIEARDAADDERRALSAQGSPWSVIYE